MCFLLFGPGGRRGGGGRMFFLAVQAGACFFAVLAGAWPPPKQQRIKHAPAQTAKLKTPEKHKQPKRPDNKEQTFLPIRSPYMGVTRAAIVSFNLFGPCKPKFAAPNRQYVLPLKQASIF